MSPKFVPFPERFVDLDLGTLRSMYLVVYNKSLVLQKILKENGIKFEPKCIEWQPELQECIAHDLAITAQANRMVHEASENE